MAGLSHLPTIEETTTILAEGQGVVQFCRVNDGGLFEIKDSTELEKTLVLFEGKKRYAYIGKRRKR